MIDENILRQTDPKQNIFIKKFSTGWRRNNIKYIFSKLKRNKAAGADNFPAEVFKFGHKNMDLWLLYLFRIFETLKVIPSVWKKAFIKPIYKGKDSNTDIANYRPIALTVVCRRIFEKFIERHYYKKYANLADSQGGFRAHRSTLDQVATLHDLFTKNDEMIASFLDIKAAFDCVDRRILWSLLVKKFNLSISTVMNLRALFDDNYCILMVGSVFSDPIEHKRGLFQGSSLSPGLFNFFIDSLLAKLRTYGKGAKFSIEIFINNLFFADDGVLTATNMSDSQDLLNICSDWSLEVGITFAPQKCGYISKNIATNSNNTLYLYGVPIAKVNKYKYLGIIMDKCGINWRLTMDIRIQAAITKINWMSRIGMNIFKWRLNSCISIYKSFIRPSLEYGLALQMIPCEIIADLQRVQILALRRIFCCPNKVSHDLLHVIPAIESMSFRNIRLNARYINSILNGNKSELPVGRIFNGEIQSGTLSGVGNSILSRFVRFNRLSDLVLTNEMPDENIMKEMRGSDISNTLMRGIFNGSSGCRRLDKNNYLGQRDTLLLPNNYALLSRRTIYVLLQWKFNLFGNHFKRCEICLETSGVDREHILICSVFNNRQINDHILNLLSTRMKRRSRIETCAMLIDRSISYLASCDTKRDRGILNELAKLLDYARLQSLNKNTNIDDEAIDYENIQDPMIKQLWDIKAYFKSRSARRRRGVGFKTFI